MSLSGYIRPADILLMLLLAVVQAEVPKWSVRAAEERLAAHYPWSKEIKTVIKRLHLETKGYTTSVRQAITHIVTCHADSLMSMYLRERHKTIINIFFRMLQFSAMYPPYFRTDALGCWSLLSACRALQVAVPSDYVMHHRKLDALEPLWQGMLEGVLKMAQQLEVNRGNPESKDDFASFRKDVFHFIASMYAMRGPVLIQDLTVYFQAANSQLKSGSTPQSQAEAETRLLAVTAIAESVTPYQAPSLGCQLSQLLSALPRLLRDPHLQQATLTCIGSLGVVLQNPRRMKAVLPAILKLIEASAEGASAAAGALKKLARQSPDSLAAFGDSFLMTIQHLQREGQIDAPGNLSINVAVLEACQPALLPTPPHLQLNEAVNDAFSRTFGTALRLLEILPLNAREEASQPRSEITSLTDVFEYAIARMGTYDDATFGTATSFLFKLVLKSQECAAFATVVDKHRLSLVKGCLQVVGADNCSEDAIDPLADLLLVLKQQNEPGTNECLKKALQQQGFLRLDSANKKRYLRRLTQNSISKRSIKKILEDMYDQL